MCMIYFRTEFHSPVYVYGLRTSAPNLTDLGMFMFYLRTKFRRPRYVYGLTSHQISQACAKFHVAMSNGSLITRV
jgi:hypothetical protein